MEIEVEDKQKPYIFCYTSGVNVSVCITTFNESVESISKLLDALNNQTLIPDEIIIVDADKNPKIQKFVNLKRFKNLKIINIKNASRAEGRNIAIKKARNEIIATTDVGCLPRKDWLENITRPFRNNRPRRNRVLHQKGISTNHFGSNLWQAPEVSREIHLRGVFPDVVAGFYIMTHRNNLQKAMRVFLGVLPKNFDKNFMPSARSMAFTKTIWKKAGGFPENLKNTAEDTLFNVKLIKAGAVFTHVKNAVVEWGMPTTIFNFYFLIFNYAKGDAESGIWWHPVKGIQSHNVKIMSIYGRYLIFVTLFILNKPMFGLIVICYMIYALWKVGIYGPLLQIVSDFAVMAGFTEGIIKKCVKI